jgi:hypothetical protein
MKVSITEAQYCVRVTGRILSPALGYYAERCKRISGSDRIAIFSVAIVILEKLQDLMVPVLVQMPATDASDQPVEVVPSTDAATLYAKI